MCVYLLHYHAPHPHATKYHCRHYLGYANNLAARLEHHKAGNGATFTDEMAKYHIEFDLDRVWEDGDRTLERKLKNGKHLSRLCPICNPKAKKEN